jgi:hypothetical protein
MKLKRIISIVVISLFTSLFVTPLVTPPAFAGTSQAVNSFSSSCSGNVSSGTFNANANFSTSFTPITSIERWEYSYDNFNWIVIANSNGKSSTSIVVSNWYANSFAPWVRNVSTAGVNGPARQPSSSSSTCSGASLVPPAVGPAVLGSFGMTQTADECRYTFSIGSYTGNAVSAYYISIVDFFDPNPDLPPSNASFSLFTGANTIGANTGTNVSSSGSMVITAADLRGAGISASMFGRLWVRADNGVRGALHNSMGIGCGLNDPVDTTRPVLSSFSSSSANGSYKQGSTINITATLSEAVTSAAQITVTLDTGETVLLSHSATNNTLTGTYTVGVGKTSSDLTVSSYVLTAAPTDASGNIMNTTTVPSGTSNIAGSKAIIIDTALPTVSNITSSPSSGTLKVGDVVLVRVEFSEVVTVSGTPQITLETGTTDRAVDYTSGSGTNTLTFSYTVQAGDTSADLTHGGTTSLVLNGGTIRDIALNNATLTLVDASSAGSLGANSAIIVDTSAPTATLTTGSITSSENAAVTSTEIGTAYLVNSAITVNNLASITGAADSSWNSVAITTANSSTSLAATGLTPGTYRLYAADAAGNLSLVSTDSVTVTLAATGAPDLVSSSDLGSSNTDNTTNDDTPEISLSGLTVGAVITLTATPSSGTAVVCSFTATGTTGSCPFTTLANGTYSVAATQTFNSVTSVASTALTGLVINKSTITTPSSPDLDATSDSGSSVTDNITSDNTPTINVSGTFSGTAVVTATKQGATSVLCTIATNTCDLATLSDGTWSISVTDTDSAGNSTTSAAVSITVDTTAPSPTVAASSVTTASGVTIRSSEVGTAYLVKTTVAVTNLASITGAVDNSMNLVAIGTAGTDTAMSTEGLLAGDYKLYVVDAAGNVSLASTNTVTVAVAAAPTATSTSAPTGTTTIGSTLTNAVTFNGVPTPTLSYQWKSCTSSTDTTTACADISGATASTFIASAIDLVGKFIRVLVTAINTISPNGSALSSPTAAITAVAPGVPTVGTPTLGDLQINVPFTVPASNGGSTIIKYEFSTDGGTTWLDRTDSSTVTSPIVIKFLSTDGTTPIVAGTTYPIQIRAVNSATNPNGASTASVSVTAATAPGAPTAVSATATGQTTATVSFTAPASNGGSAITTYTVTASPGGATASGGTSPITVSGLTASTAYTFTVTATNAAATSAASSASTAITTNSPPPAPVCDAACEAAIKAAADKVIADKAAAAKVVADKVASDVVAKVVADTVAVDKSAAESAAKAAVEKAIAAVVAKAAADLAAANAAALAKAAADAQQAAIVAATAAAGALRSATTSAAAKAATTATAVKAANTAANTVAAAAAAAKTAATAKAAATNAAKAVDIAIGAAGAKAAAAVSAAQANAIAAAAKAAAEKAAKAAADKAAAAKAAANKANQAAAAAAAKIVIEQKEAADAAAQAKIATDAALKATEEKIAAANEAQKSADAVVKALEEKIALAEASVKAKDIAERAAIDKKIEEIAAKVADAQKSADAANAKVESTAVAAVQAEANAAVAVQAAQTQSAEAAVAKTESINKTSSATQAAADAGIASKIAAAAVAAAAKVPAKATPTPKPTATPTAKPSAPPSKNSTTATISGLKPGQKVKVTVNVKGKK